MDLVRTPTWLIIVYRSWLSICSVLYNLLDCIDKLYRIESFKSSST